MNVSGLPVSVILYIQNNPPGTWRIAWQIHQSIPPIMPEENSYHFIQSTNMSGFIVLSS